MATFDPHSLFGYSTVASVTSQGAGVLVLVVATGDGTKFSVGQNVVMCPPNTGPTLANAMVGRITNIATDTLTISYPQEGSSTVSVLATWQIANTITPKALTDIETAVNNVSLNTGNIGIKGQGMFLFSTFKNGLEHLYLFASNDGITFQPLNVDFSYDPPTPNFRDPSIIYYNNLYYLCYSHVQGPGYTGTTFGVASSPDLQNWTFITNVSVAGVANAFSVWAPEWFVDSDGSLHVICAISTDMNATHQLYEIHPTNLAYTTWSTPVNLPLTGGTTNAIDPFMVKVGSTYYLWFHDVTNTYITFATSSTFLGSYAIQHTGNWAGWGLPSIEGPCLVQINSTTWRIYFDYPTSQGIYYSESSDGAFAVWSTKQLITTPGFTASQGTIIRTTDVITMRNIINTTLQNILKITNVKCRVYLGTGVQSIPDSTFTKVKFDTVTYDPYGTFDITTNYVFTVPTPGYYDIRSNVLFSSMTDAKRMILRIYKNGSTLLTESQAQTGAAADDGLTISDIQLLAAGDTIQVQCYQTTGGAINISNNTAQTFLAIRWLGE